MIDVVPGVGQGCPAGYEQLTDRFFPGTSSGCDCQRSRQFGFEIKSGGCTSNMTRSGCRSIGSVGRQELNVIHGEIFCGNRAGLSFLDTKRPTVNPDTQEPGCEDGYKMCGSRMVEYGYCTQETEPCPLMDVQLIPDTDPIPEGYTAKPYSEGIQVIQTTGEDPVVPEFGRLPIVDFELTEVEVCADK